MKLMVALFCFCVWSVNFRYIWESGRTWEEMYVEKTLEIDLGDEDNCELPRAANLAYLEIRKWAMRKGAEEGTIYMIGIRRLPKQGKSTGLNPAMGEK